MNTNFSDRESRPIEGVSAVVLKDIGRLVIRQGAQEALEVEADSQMLPNVQTELVNGVLELGMSRSWSERVANSFTLRHVAYYLTVKDLKSIDLKGISNLEIHDFSGSELVITTRGHIGVKIDGIDLQNLVGKFHWSTTVHVSGRARNQEIFLSGSSKYNAANLETEQTTLTLSDKSQADVTVSGKLSVQSSEESYVQYHGDPQVMINNTADSGIHHF
ncbi:MAG: DUF2807 domain-containing protein [Anaerolineae bacterium]|nr:DUF2807 domain-containing protein [Anaerolineae bacterium]